MTVRKTLFAAAASAALIAMPGYAQSLSTDTAVGAAVPPVSTELDAATNLDVTTPTDPVSSPLQTTRTGALDSATQVDTSVQSDPVQADTSVTTRTDMSADMPSAQTQAQTSADAGAVTQATSADVTAGAMVHDTSGGMVGTVESVDAAGAVVAVGATKVQIPVASFAKNDRGLVIAMTRAEIEAAAQGERPGA